MHTMGGCATTDYLVWGFENPGSEPDAVTRLEGISGPGDSGGPALINVAGEYLIVGISSGQSTGATNGLEGRYGVTEYYTRVSTYADWIADTISN
jgi:secreted trypsin-like serine protease